MFCFLDTKNNLKKEKPNNPQLPLPRESLCKEAKSQMIYCQKRLFWE